MSKLLRPFHLAFPVRDLEEAKLWYCETFNCELGRQSADWVDFNFFGHQIVAHLSKTAIREDSNEVDQQNVPVRHFGVVLDWKEWRSLSEKLQKLKIKFIINPYIRFKGEVGEQATMFILDPSGNALEFKSFKDPKQLFKA